MTVDRTLSLIRDISARFAGERAERQRRRALDPADFAAIADAGFLGTGLPEAEGGYWKDSVTSIRPACEMLRILAQGDPSVALVCAMHPTVLSVWLPHADAAPEFRDAWRAQRRMIFDSVKNGCWWGTITSEPGSGGDMLKTRAVAAPAENGRYRVTGDKHFGSGSGILSFAITMARPEGEDSPDVFVLDLRGVPWDGSTGMKLAAEWDGHGMPATQSHAFRFDGFPAMRKAWPGNFQIISPAVAIYCSAAFSAVIVGIVETAVDTARALLLAKRSTLRAYEQVEWSRVETEGWLVRQAYEGILRDIESGDGLKAFGTGLLGKTAIAELSETLMLRLCKIIGGATFARGSPFGHWAEDVRALGFLRPPWGLAYDNIFSISLPP
ncbi:MAG TPA: acyl-CoA dehydrogenase [Candidatus Cybelea sp.]|nr:acyl-CoA dehydrogenase [Candidatus Cybelea sp.]